MLPLNSFLRVGMVFLMDSDTFSSCLVVTVQRGIRNRDLESLCFSPLNIQIKVHIFTAWFNIWFF